jgi:hypothetical protein
MLPTSWSGGWTAVVRTAMNEIRLWEHVWDCRVTLFGGDDTFELKSEMFENEKLLRWLVLDV